MNLIWQYTRKNPYIPICCRKAYSEPSQTSKMDLFARIISSFQPLTIFAKNSILDASLGDELMNLFLRNSWRTKDLYVLFSVGTIVRDSHHCKSPTNHEQDLNLRRIWFQASEFWMLHHSSCTEYTNQIICSVGCVRGAFRTLLNIFNWVSKNSLPVSIRQLFLQKCSIIDVWQGPKYISDWAFKHWFWMHWN